jgi:hypothetical protein
LNIKENIHVDIRQKQNYQFLFLIPWWDNSKIKRMKVALCMGRIVEGDEEVKIRTKKGVFEILYLNLKIPSFWEVFLKGYIRNEHEISFMDTRTKEIHFCIFYSRTILDSPILLKNWFNENW